MDPLLGTPKKGSKRGSKPVEKGSKSVDSGIRGVENRSDGSKNGPFLDTLFGGSHDLVTPGESGVNT